MKIDIFSHILPEKYLAGILKKAKNLQESRAIKNLPATNIEIRKKVMDRYPDVMQVLTVSPPPLDEVVSPTEAAELSRIANDELAEIVMKNPDRFLGGVACIALNNLDAALDEIDRAITHLGLKGVQMFSRIKGEQLDDPKFKPLYQKMAKYDFPIWIHPVSDPEFDETVFGWPFATANTMRRLVTSGIFNELPDLKFITHHCGAMAPYFEGRIKWLMPLSLGKDHPVKNPEEHFRKFYNDTATYGSTSALMCGYEFFGPDHLLFGSDAPYGPGSGLTLETILSIENMNISIGEKDKIFSQNAIRLLKIAT
jgi:aminocarboxymuconate-semialdehyde decarboxylase